jgi:glycerol uptake facilitator-like aquaporin
MLHEIFSNILWTSILVFVICAIFYDTDFSDKTDEVIARIATLSIFTSIISLLGVIWS